MTPHDWVEAWKYIGHRGRSQDLVLFRCSRCGVTELNVNIKWLHEHPEEVARLNGPLPPYHLDCDLQVARDVLEA